MKLNFSYLIEVNGTVLSKIINRKEGGGRI